MTGHKSNSFLKPLISLKEIFFTSFLPRRRGRKGEKVVKQWALLVRTGKEIAAPSLTGGVGSRKKKKRKKKYKRLGKNYS